MGCFQMNVLRCAGVSGPSAFLNFRKTHLMRRATQGKALAFGLASKSDGSLLNSRPAHKDSLRRARWVPTPLNNKSVSFVSARAVFALQG
eukprot:6204344-Pleurochrysis_carterae.AAC.1